jgi:hypothetical protein
MSNDISYTQKEKNPYEMEHDEEGNLCGFLFSSNLNAEKRSSRRSKVTATVGHPYNRHSPSSGNIAVGGGLTGV